MEFKELDDIAFVKGGKRLPKGQMLVTYKTKHPYLRISDYDKKGKVDLKKIQYVKNETFEEIKNYIISKGDVFLSIVGTIGIVDYINDELDGASLTENAVKITVKDNERYNPIFLTYYLKSPSGQFEIHSRTVGTTQKKLAIKRIKKINVPVISLDKQKRIASILSNLDSKIEVNNKIISNLESQAQAIFKSWFVDFEPFQDGDFVESELGMIPEGWEVKSLSDIAFFKNGLAMQRYRPEINDPSLPVLKIRELNSGSTDFSSDRCRIDIDDSVKVYDGDLIFSWSGTLSCKLWTGGNAGLNQHLFKVTSEKYEKWFNYSWIKFHMNEFIRIAQDKATTMGHIKRSHLDEAKVLIPAIDIYEKIDKLMKPIIELIIKLGIQNTKLAELRDALLPKLMAGEIDVSNIKIEGEEVKNE